ncbi:similar to Saccharomyces cerevisiae YOR238W Putative protein of unknown function [Maudiozyma saulgeensis]|uniref:Uncharacterized protein n=1 Tax=Maudiozyma saulgeensis TaxID=1789683 RepID=A0A1X7R3J3_9SACH|nr:similar to Saccharomyces cerevisiae YOR238W Putative protein of unknown function [Kazachstania saulgeensis]
MPTNNTKTKLIIVPCHSVWNFAEPSKSNSKYHLGESQDQWSLAPFQYEGNDHISFIKHSLRAIVELINDIDDNIVIFSGSQTKLELGPMSEAQSYYFLTYKIIQYWRNADELPKNFDYEILDYLKSISLYVDSIGGDLAKLFNPRNISTEEFSLDSFDNLLFSIARFNEIFLNYPKDIKIVGFGFKEERFINYHAKAIDFPQNKINYVSIGPEPSDYTEEQLTEYFFNISKAENKNALNYFAKDWYGTCQPLRKKKDDRNPYNRTPQYEILNMLLLKSEITNCESHFNLYIKGKMPWSMRN